jgi:hypothetical protein
MEDPARLPSHFDFADCDTGQDGDDGADADDGQQPADNEHNVDHEILRVPNEKGLRENENKQREKLP